MEWRDPEVWGPCTWKDEATFTKMDKVTGLGENDQSSFVRLILDSTPQTSAEKDEPLETWTLACTQSSGSGPKADRDLAEECRSDPWASGLHHQRGCSQPQLQNHCEARVRDLRKGSGRPGTRLVHN